jgi:predicted metalloprotease with PDZ domain
MKKLLYGVLLLNVIYACSPKTGDALKEEPANLVPVAASLDLTNVQDDRVWVDIDPGMFTQDTVIFRLPRVVQGTYDISDFGSFTEGFAAYSYSGDPIDAEQIDVNSWMITNASSLDKLGYYVNDTFDIESTDQPTPFSPSGTNIHPEVYVLNLHGFVGYFEDMEDNAYSISITAPADFEKSSALPVTSSTVLEEGVSVKDTYFAERYFEVTDNPMLYGYLTVEEFMVGDIKIVLSVYSPNNKHTAGDLKNNLATMMEAQKNYLGELNSTPRYDVFLYLTPGGEGQPGGLGALEHHTSTVAVAPEQYNLEGMDGFMTDVVSHEFFHIVTPLTVHSEDVHYFDYNDPTFSKHLWVYEGVTEYFASHFQVYEDLQSRPEFYDKIMGKINTSLSLDDEMSFTVMSENVIDEPYASNYYNVYMKGALIGMCVDILMREQSNGSESMLSLMKNLSAKYGMEKPFEDDNLIDEITEMTYPEVGEFLETHVVGTTPINYEEIFSKVGLKYESEEVNSTLFLNGQSPFINVRQSGEIYFMSTNSTLDSLGVQSGDVFKSLNGTDYTLENIRNLIIASMQWTPDTELTMVVMRDGEELELSGTLGTPTVMEKKLVEDEGATDEQIQLRNYWLER